MSSRRKTLSSLTTVVSTTVDNQAHKDGWWRGGARLFGTVNDDLRGLLKAALVPVGILLLVLLIVLGT